MARKFVATAYERAIQLIVGLFGSRTLACWVARSSRAMTSLASAAPLDDGFQLGRELGDEMLPVPGDLRLFQDFLPRLGRQMRPGGNHARTQPAHQAFVFGRISKLVF